MGLVHFVLSAVGRSLDAVCLLLDLNFVVVHTVVRTVLAVVAFIHSLPGLVLSSALELGNCLLLCLVSLAHGTLSSLGGLLLALEGLLESLKMVGYLSLHFLLRGKDHVCRGLMSVLEGCGIAVSLAVYFANTAVNYALIAAQKAYLAVVSVWQTVSSPLQKLLELLPTALTVLYRSLVGTSALLWSPCQLALDFAASLLHMFVSVFILNVYGLVLTVAITLTTTAYLNPALTRQAAVQVAGYLGSFPALRRLHDALLRLAAGLRRSQRFAQRTLHHFSVLERGLWRHLAQLRSQFGLALRTHLNRHNNRAQGDGDGDRGEERRDPPDGRAGEGRHGAAAAPSSSSTERLLETQSDGDGGKPVLPENLLSLLQEQEERKKCVICQDSAKTVVLLPCRHLCLCRGCTDILLAQPIYLQNCPLCRQIIFNTMDVYL